MNALICHSWHNFIWARLTVWFTLLSTFFSIFPFIQYHSFAVRKEFSDEWITSMPIDFFLRIGNRFFSFQNQIEIYVFSTPLKYCLTLDYDLIPGIIIYKLIGGCFNAIFFPPLIKCLSAQLKSSSSISISVIYKN